jgi:hypothetical protein
MTSQRAGPLGIGCMRSFTKQCPLKLGGLSGDHSSAGCTVVSRVRRGSLDKA